MGKRKYVVDMHEVIETALELTGIPNDDDDTDSWNKMVDEINQDAPDGAAFGECGSFDYDLHEVEDELLENPNSIFYKTLKHILTVEKKKQLTLEQ